MDVIFLWVLQTLGGATLVASVGSGIRYLRKKWKLQQGDMEPLAGQEPSKLEAELEKLRAENFNFRVARAIKRKFKERGRGLGN